MSLFEFLMVLVSIIVGLGVAEVLNGIARQIRSRNQLKWYWLQSCGVALVLVALLQSWWELWDLRHMPEWRFSSMTLMLVGPAALYMISHLMFPEPGETTDLKTYYYDQMRTIWWFAIVSTLASTLFRPIAFGSELVHMDNATSAFFVIGFLALAVSRNTILHSILVPAFLAMLIGDVLIWHPSQSAS